jgi:RNA polymerase sigma factor (sigma-70 family)
MIRVDPLRNPEPLIRRVYAYAAYRLGDGPDAEDATSDTFERALRYRHRDDRTKGEPIAWLLGIARRAVDDLYATRPPVAELTADVAGPEDIEPETVRRLTVQKAVLTLDERSRELVALRYGADLTARQIAEMLGERTNTVEVALHRAHARLRASLDGEQRHPSPASGTAGGEKAVSI